MKHKLTRENFKGPWAGLPVAWDSNFKFNEKRYYKDVERCCRAGFPGVYTGGTTGEFYAMDFEEFKRVSTITAEVCQKYNVPVMIGCSSTYTIGAIERAKFAGQIGADAIQLALPFWMEVDDDFVIDFFKDVMAEVSPMVLSVYETTRSKKILSLQQHKQIKEKVPGYLMVKANSDTLGDSVYGCGELSKFVNVFVGEHRWAELGPAGAQGACSSLIYWFPHFTSKLWKSVASEDWATVKKGCTAISYLFDFLGEQFKGRGFTDSAFDKIGGAVDNFLSGGLVCRRPYPHGDFNDVLALRKWCEKNYPEFLQS